MSPIDLSSLVKAYESKWVALSEDYASVLGVGKTAQEADRDARSKGQSEFVLFYVQPSDMLYCGRLL